MNTSAVVDAITSLEKKAPVDDGTLTYLQSVGLTQSLTPQEHASMRADADRISSLRQQVAQAQQVSSEQHMREKQLRERINSFWHKALHAKSYLSQEVHDLKSARGKRASANLHHAALTEEIARLEKLEKTLDAYTKHGESFVAPSVLGLRRRTQIEVRKERIGTMPYDEFIKEIESIEEKIGTRYERFVQMRQRLITDGFERTQKVTRLAIALSGQQGDMDDIYGRAMNVNSELYKNNWQSYDRLPIVAAVSAQQGDIEDCKERMWCAFKRLKGAGRNGNYQTLLMAANIAKAPCDDEEKRYQRFEALEDALTTDRHLKGSAATRMLASTLIVMPGEPHEVAANYREIEDELIRRNWALQEGIIPLTLTAGQGTPAERADSYKKTYNIMLKEGWQDTSAFYAPAALLSTLPGKKEEHVDNLNDLVNRMHADGWEHPTVYATSILAGSMTEWIKESGRWSTDDAASHLYLPQSGFSIPGAIVGDLFDNGQADMSGGFVVGGVIGSLLD